MESTAYGLVAKIRSLPVLKMAVRSIPYSASFQHLSRITSPGRKTPPRRRRGRQTHGRNVVAARVWVHCRRAAPGRDSRDFSPLPKNRGTRPKDVRCAQRGLRLGGERELTAGSGWVPHYRNKTNSFAFRERVCSNSMLVKGESAPGAGMSKERVDFAWLRWEAGLVL